MHPVSALMGRFSPGRTIQSLYDDKAIQMKIFLTDHDKVNGFRGDICLKDGFQGFKNSKHGEYAFFEWRKN